MPRVESVESPRDPEEDGFRILAARFRGRGLHPPAPLDAQGRPPGTRGQELTLRRIEALAERQDVALTCDCEAARSPAAPATRRAP